MTVHARGAMLAAVVSFALSLCLVFALAVAAGSLAAAHVPVGMVSGLGVVLGLLVRGYAGLVAGRHAWHDRLDVRGAVLTGALGCAAGYAVLQLANAATAVVLLARPAELDWSVLYGVSLWLAAGAAGGLLGWRVAGRAGGRHARAVRRGTTRRIPARSS